MTIAYTATAVKGCDSTPCECSLSETTYILTKYNVSYICSWTMMTDVFGEMCEECYANIQMNLYRNGTHYELDLVKEIHCHSLQEFISWKPIAFTACSAITGQFEMEYEGVHDINDPYCTDFVVQPAKVEFRSVR